jgi:uncharacterized protein
VRTVGRQPIWALAMLLAVVLAVAGCSSSSGGNAAGTATSATSSTSPTATAARHGWVEDEVTFVDPSLGAGLTIHGTYRYLADGPPGPAALLVSESGNTDRNGDNAVAGPVGNMRQLAEYLSGKGFASLRYDKVGTGKTGLGPYALHPADVGSAVYTAGAKAAVRFLAQQPRTDKSRISAYGLGEGTVHAMALAVDTSPDAPKIHAIGLFQPLSARYLDIITGRVRADVESAVNSGAKTRQQGDDVIATWNAAVVQARTTGTAPAKLPEGLGAILNPGNVKAVVEADAIDPLAVAATVPPGTPVLLSCSDSDGQADCAAEKPLIGALGHTALTVVELKGVNHVLRDDPTDNVANYAKKDPLSPQLITALDGFVGK